MCVAILVKSLVAWVAAVGLGLLEETTEGPIV